ncbi:hypothetical protein EYB45_09420 [Erythrobacteraceae bacterium CFH 75059]|uniref:hypothetical protein n=1 Tax=Qipengyuania thermophila TaxID=2509361 RepID=UPI0010224214|nr:hypothetical protein [Qipengyuania thermophila]TCD04121.1 hypothetical protein EYB45_09420 [Erythrobacteraceae bacterium CFH 75059]
MRGRRVLASAAILLMAGVPAQAQRSGELVLYSDIGFRGQTFVITGPRENVRVPFRVRSAQVAAGDTWEICPQTRYRGACNTVIDSQGNIAWTVQSARPSRQSGGLAPANPASLRGMTAEFFPQPSDSAGRMLSCERGSASAACAAQSADRFCRTRGWTAAAYERQETVGGRNYLADVLCTRSRVR